MFLVSVLRYALVVFGPLSIALTTYLYLYPVFHFCAFPSPVHNDFAAYVNTLGLHLPGDNYTHIRNATHLAPFRLLALGDPQLEGDSSIPDPSAASFPNFWKFWEDALLLNGKDHRLIQRIRHSLHDVVDFYFDDIPKTIDGYRKRLDLFGNDFYLAHIYRVMHWWARPTHVSVLGDLLGSQWVDDDEFGRRSWRFWNHVMKGGMRISDEITAPREHGNLDALTLGDEAKVWTKRIINIAGNHDIGYAGDLTRERFDRFEKAFGRANYELRFQLDEASYLGKVTNETTDGTIHEESRDVPELRIIVLNDMNLDTPATDGALQTETYEFMNKIISASHEVDRSAHFTLLLTHIPLYKDEGVCVDPPFFSFHEPYWPFHSGVKEQNHLSADASKGILEGIFGMSSNPSVDGAGVGRRGLIMAGHDHEGCDVYHYIRQTPVVESTDDAEPDSTEEPVIDGESDFIFEHPIAGPSVNDSELLVIGEDETTSQLEAVIEQAPATGSTDDTRSNSNEESDFALKSTPEAIAQDDVLNILSEEAASDAGNNPPAEVVIEVDAWRESLDSPPADLESEQSQDASIDADIDYVPEQTPSTPPVDFAETDGSVTTEKPLKVDDAGEQPSHDVDSDAIRPDSAHDVKIENNSVVADEQGGSVEPSTDDVNTEELTEAERAESEISSEERTLAENLESYVGDDHEAESESEDVIEPPRPTWQQSTWPHALNTSLLTTSNTTGIREITVRSMMGDFNGNAGLLSIWFDPGTWTWQHAYSSCSFGPPWLWWAVHVIDLVTLIIAVITLTLWAFHKWGLEVSIGFRVIRIPGKSPWRSVVVRRAPSMGHRRKASVRVRSGSIREPMSAVLRSRSGSIRAPQTMYEEYSATGMRDSGNGVLRSRSGSIRSPQTLYDDYPATIMRPPDYVTVNRVRGNSLRSPASPWVDAGPVLSVDTNVPTVSRSVRKKRSKRAMRAAAAAAAAAEAGSGSPASGLDAVKEDEPGEGTTEKWPEFNKSPV